MIVTVYKQITRRDSRILESFSFSPKKNIIWKDGTRIKDYLIFLSDALSISDQYSLLSRKEYDFYIEKEYTYSNEKQIPRQSLSYSFSYIPFMGKKKCTKCIHVRKTQSGALYCSGRVKKILGDSWPDCLYYYENSILMEKNEKLLRLVKEIYQ